MKSPLLALVALIAFRLTAGCAAAGQRKLEHRWLFVMRAKACQDRRLTPGRLLAGYYDDANQDIAAWGGP